MKPVYLYLPLGVLNYAFGIAKRDVGVFYILHVIP